MADSEPGTEQAPALISVGRGAATTVMVVDFVRFSALMHANEGGALDKLAQFEDLIGAEVKPANGRVVKFVGDGALLTFHDAREAVAFALALQEKALAKELGLRIGIHHGYVVAHPTRPDDIIGDAVNIAFRIQALADPGGIALTEGVREQVQNALDWRSRPLQLFRLGPVPVRNIRNPPIVSLMPPANAQAAAWQLSKAVNLGMDRTHRYLTRFVRVALVATAAAAAFAFWISRPTGSVRPSTAGPSGKLARVRDLAVSPTSSRVAAVTWTAAPGAAAYLVEYGAVNKRKTVLVAATDAPVTETRAALSRLSAGRTYLVRVTAIDAQGSSGYPSELRFIQLAPSRKAGPK